MTSALLRRAFVPLVPHRLNIRPRVPLSQKYQPLTEKWSKKKKEKKCVGDRIKREKTKAPLMWLPERKCKVRREWTVNTVTVQEGLKKSRLEEGTSQMCA